MEKLASVFPFLLMAGIALLFIRWSRAGIKRYSEKKLHGQNPPRPIGYYILGWIGIGWMLTMILVLLGTLFA